MLASISERGYIIDIVSVTIQIHFLNATSYIVIGCWRALVVALMNTVKMTKINDYCLGCFIQIMARRCICLHDLV